MRSSRGIASLCALLALSLLVGAAAAQDPSRAELKRRFEARYPQLAQLEAAGTVGETWEGFVAAVEPGSEDDEAVRKLLREENADRTTLYRLLAGEVREDLDDAKRKKVTPETIAERNAWRNFERAADTERLRVAETIWVTKRERPWLLRLLEHEDRGRIGETLGGRVAAVSPEHARDAEIARMVERENAARREAEERLARAEGVAPEEIAKRRAALRFKSAHRGVALQGPDGRWAPKRESAGVAHGGGGGEG